LNREVEKLRRSRLRGNSSAASSITNVLMVSNH
jgi:hypothetical protein